MNIDRNSYILREHFMFYVMKELNSIISVDLIRTTIRLGPSSPQKAL